MVLIRIKGSMTKRTITGVYGLGRISKPGRSFILWAGAAGEDGAVFLLTDLFFK